MKEIPLLVLEFGSLNFYSPNLNPLLFFNPKSSIVPSLRNIASLTMIFHHPHYHHPPLPPHHLVTGDKGWGDTAYKGIS